MDRSGGSCSSPGPGLSSSPCPGPGPCSSPGPGPGPCSSPGPACSSLCPGPSSTTPWFIIVVFPYSSVPVGQRIVVSFISIDPTYLSCFSALCCVPMEA